MGIVFVSSFEVHKTVVNHTKLPEILISNMAAHKKMLADKDNTYY
jgi:hypothetical protein